MAQAKTPDAAHALVQDLLAQALEPTSDPAARYALCDAARHVAERFGNLDLAIRACDQIGQGYDVDSLAMKDLSLAACIKAIRSPAEIPPLAHGALELNDEALDEDRYQLAERFAAKAVELARRSRQRELVMQAAQSSQQVRVLAAAYEPVPGALETLRTQPEHAPSHAAVGRFYCLLKGEWEAGLVHLAQGDDETLRALAERDRSLPTDAEERLALGDAWLAHAKSVKESERPQVQQRAAYWYRLAEPDLAGFDRARVEKVLKSLPAETLAAGQRVKTRKLWRSVSGNWKVSYDNGAVRTYRFDSRGNALFVEENLAGRLTGDGDSLKLDLGDGKLERLRLDKDQLLVEHFNPASGFPDSPPLAGRGTRAR